MMAIVVTDYDIGGANNGVQCELPFEILYS